MADLDLNKIGWDYLIKELKNKNISFSPIKKIGRKKYLECNNKIIFVKTKKGNRWPTIKGITNNEIYVFLDFQNKNKSERPDFYILNVENYVTILNKRCSELGMKNRHIAKNDTLISDKEITKQGGPYEGFSVDCSYVLDYLEKWEKLR